MHCHPERSSGFAKRIGYGVEGLQHPVRITSRFKAFSPRRAILKIAPRLSFAIVTITAAAQTPATWRYDLHPGDHLVYNYTLHREVRTDEVQTVVEAKFHTHVLIAGEHAGVLSAGFQRNRDSANLLVYRIKGKDKLAQERPNFEKRMQTRLSLFSEAQEFTASGEPRYSWEIVRESASHLLPDLHEINALPPHPVKTGDRWPALDMLGMQFEWTGSEPLHGRNCQRVSGKAVDGSATITYWWSPDSGVLDRVELDGTYSVPGGTSHEQATLDLESRSRNESVSNWMGNPETRLASLDALLLSLWLPLNPEDLTWALKSGNAAAQRLALAVADRRGHLLPAGVLSEIANSNPEIKTFAADLQPQADVKSANRPCLPPPARKPAPPKTGTVLRVALPEKPGPNIPYFLRIPITYRGDRPLPLLIYLSGGAGFALDAVNTGNDAIASTNYLVLYPQAGDYWWTPGAAERLHAAFNDVLRDFNVDRDRVYLAGFSNGGTGALYMAELWPDQFAAVVSLMGAGQCMEDVQKNLANLANLPILFVHGEKDTRVAPSCSQTTYDSLNELRPRVASELRLLPGREHDITLQSDDGLTLSFLKDKVREAFPKRVSFYLNDLNFPRQYWIEVLEKKSVPAEITAEVKKDNRIEIHSSEIKKLRLHLRPEMFPQTGPVRIAWNGKLVFEGLVKDVCAAADAGSDDPKLGLADNKDFSLP